MTDKRSKEIECLRSRVAELEKHALTEDQCWFYQAAIDVVHAQSALDAGCPAQAMLKTARAEMMKAAGAAAGEKDGNLVPPEPPAAAECAEDKRVLLEAVKALLDDVKARHPGQDLYCPYMRRLDALVTEMEGRR